MLIADGKPCLLSVPALPGPLSSAASLLEAAGVGFVRPKLQVRCLAQQGSSSKILLCRSSIAWT